MMLWVGVTLVSGGQVSFAASFNCAQAKTAKEKMICSDAKLNKLDEQLGDIFKDAVQRAPSIRQDQRDWLRQMDQCKSVDCLVKGYEARIEELITIILRADRDAMRAEQARAGTSAPEPPARAPATAPPAPSTNPERRPTTPSPSATSSGQKDTVECFGTLNAHVQTGGKLSSGNQAFMARHQALYNEKVKPIGEKVLSCRRGDTGAARHKSCAESLEPAERQLYQWFNAGQNFYLHYKQRGESEKVGVILLACSV